MINQPHFLPKTTPFFLEATPDDRKSPNVGYVSCMDSWAARVGLEVRPTVDEVELRAARHLHAKTYLEAGYVDHIAEDGLIDDPWIPYSDFFVAVTGEGEVWLLYTSDAADE